MILRNQWRLLMSRNAISANPEHYIFKIFQGSMPPDPLEGLKIFFLTTSWLKNFFPDRLPPPNKKQRFSHNWEYFMSSFLTGTDYPYFEHHPS